MPHDLTSGQNQIYIFQWNKGYRMHCMLQCLLCSRAQSIQVHMVY